MVAIFFCFSAQNNPVFFFIVFFTFQGPHGRISIEIFYLDVRAVLYLLDRLHLGVVS